MQNSNSYLLRTPVYSLDRLKFINEHIKQAPDKFCNIIFELRHQDTFCEALYYASSALYQKFKYPKASSSDEEKYKVAVSVYKYYSRMCSRPTPFGTFSGVEIGNISDQETAISLSTLEAHQKVIRFDTGYLLQLSNEILHDEQIRNQSTYLINTTLYKVNDRYRYIENEFNGKTRDYRISGIESFRLFNKILKAFKGREITLRRFIKYLESEGVDEKQGKDFFYTLVDNQLIASKLDINITGEDYLTRIQSEIAGFESIDHIKQKVDFLTTLLKALNSGALSPEDADKELMTTFPSQEVTNCFQADLKITTVKNNLSQKVATDITEQLGELIDLFARPPVNKDLNEFKRIFVERYGDLEMPLTFVLDPDIGISYSDSRIGSNPLIEAVDRLGSDTDSYYGAISLFKTLLINKSYQQNMGILSLSEKDLQLIRKDKVNALYESNSYYILGSLIADSVSEVEQLNYKFEVRALVNGSAANLMSRFCHLDSQIQRSVDEIIQSEVASTDDWLEAEIVHLNSNEGNITFRPNLRPFEIPFASVSCIDQDHQIAVNDIYISVHNNQLYLRSRSKNKYIRPRLTTAHNYKTGLPIYRLLCDLQAQYQHTNLNWTWEGLSGLSFCPRIEYRNLVLARARWIVYLRDLAETRLEAFVAHIIQLRKNGLPQLVTLTSYDNELLLDADLDISIQIMFDALRKAEQIILTEHLNDTYRTFINAGAESYCNEILLSFTTLSASRYPAIPPQIQRIKKQKKIKQLYLPGEECLYLKIYCGEKIAEEILIDDLANIYKQFVENDPHNYWFFIRYYDPNPHLRVRFFAKNTPFLYNTLLPKITKQLKDLIDRRVITTIQVDAYKREIDRYGSENMEKCERLFYHNSATCVRLLGYLRQTVKNEDYRIFAAVAMADRYISGVYQNAVGKYSFCASRKQFFIREFESSVDIKVSLKRKARQYRSHINLILSPEMISDNEYLIKIRKILDVSYPEEFINACSEDLLSSFIHMAINRMFMIEQRLHEMFVYDLLENFYRSVIAKKNLKSVLNEI